MTKYHPRPTDIRNYIDTGYCKGCAWQSIRVTDYTTTYAESQDAANSLDYTHNH